MLILSHPTGGACARRAALAFQRAGVLGEFWTCLHTPESPVLQRMFPGAYQRLARRTFPSELGPHLHAAPIREIGRLMAAKSALRSLARAEGSPISTDSVYRSLDRRVSRRIETGRFTAVYAFEDGAEESFAVAGRRGMLRFYDLPSGYWRATRDLCTEEAELQPAWASTLLSLRESNAKRDRKDAELEHADIVFVPSQFALRTLERSPGFSAAAVVAPFGVADAEPAETDVDPGSSSRAGTLRVLFAGPLSQTKGLSYLFEAVALLQPGVELTLVGPRPQADCEALTAELRRHRWIASSSPARLRAEIARADVFVLPSIVDGFGSGLLEAMAGNLPIVATSHSAAPDLIQDGKEGFIVPIRSAEAIASVLDRLRSDPAFRLHLGQAAGLRASLYSWFNYEEILTACALTGIARI